MDCMWPMVIHETSSIKNFQRNGNVVFLTPLAIIYPYFLILSTKLYTYKCLEEQLNEWDEFCVPTKGDVLHSYDL